MNIAFIKTLGIKDGKLENKDRLHNHLGSLHAGAIFSFAENASGEYLREKFPDLKDRVMPLLRESSIKYKKQATSTLKSKAYSKEVEKFKSQFDKKGRATIIVDVNILDEKDEIVFVGNFKWYIQKL